MDPGLKIVIIVVVLIAVIGLAAAASVFFFVSPFATITRVSTPGPVTVTGLYLYIAYPNYTATTGYFGSSFRYLNIGPIYLQHSESYKTSFTLTLPSTETTHYVDRIDTAFSGGFTLQSTSPSPPFPVAPGSSTTITLTIQAPSTDYDGSVTIDLFTH